MAGDFEEFGGWPTVLGTVTAGRDLTEDVAEAAMAEILNGDATPSQIAGLIVALRMKGETIDELTGLVRAMLDASVPVSLPAAVEAIDIVGTGGDKAHTINVSTISSFVVGGAGATVCKHGNRAASSACGSADLLEALGVVIDLGPAGVARCVAEVGMGFCFAPRFHAAMRHAVPTRRELGVPTVFNFLGPMANPARVTRLVIGVADLAVAERMVAVLAANGAQRAMVVHGDDGLDELTTTTTSTVLELRDGMVRQFTLDPTDLGLASASADDLRGGNAEHNAALARAVLSGAPGPHRDVILLNAAAGLVTAGLADELADGVVLAGRSIDEGHASAVVERLVAVSTDARASDLD
ncbi:MAG: anthranilate phosphoribosyltransferase [Acidimicrobiales bacterium]